mmetsp:Transcript_75963/g.173953  ORF Transcript_75963/g.173953 Transcript_75963/m.173953 type:complete len:622 (-) Transcript_75963:19-1884(-)
MLTQLGCVPVVQLVDGLEYEVIHVFHDEQPILFSKLERLGWKHQVEQHRAVIHVFQGRPRVTREQQDLKTKHLVAGAPVSPRDHFDNDRCCSSASDTTDATPVFRSASEQKEICNRLAVPRQARSEAQAGSSIVVNDSSKDGQRGPVQRCPLPRPVKPSKPVVPTEGRSFPREEKMGLSRHKSEERRVQPAVSAVIDRLSKPRCRQLPRADSLPNLDEALTAALGMEPDARGPLKATKVEQQLIAERLSRPRASPKAEPEEPVVEAPVRSRREQQAACQRLSGVKPERPASSDEDVSASPNLDSIVMVPFDFRVQPRVVEDVLSVPRGVFRIDEEAPPRQAPTGRSRPAGLPYASVAARRRPAQQRGPVADSAASSAPVISEEVFSRIDSLFADVGREAHSAGGERPTRASSSERGAVGDSKAEKAAGVELVEEVMWTALMLLKMGGCQTTASLVADWCEMVLPAAAARGWLPSRATRDRIAAVFPSLLVCLEPSPQPMRCVETMARLRACRDAFLLRAQQSKSGSASEGSTCAESRHSVSDSHDEEMELEADGGSATAAGSSDCAADLLRHDAVPPATQPEPERVAERVPRKPRRTSLSFWTPDSLANIAPQCAAPCGLG